MTRILYEIKKIILKVTPKHYLETLTEIECAIAKKWAQNAHGRLMTIQWSVPPQPEHFDHTIDLFYQWPTLQKSFWVERGVFSGLTLQGGKVLELACGDGFNARYFYSLRVEEVIACDFDEKAINTAQRKNASANITFQLADIRTDMPQGKFENIIWDAAIEHFTPDEISLIITNIKARLAYNGILSGYTIVERDDGTKSLSHHEYEFKSKDDLLRFFLPHFKRVKVFESIHPDRHNLYFWASDGILPFDDEWPSMTTCYKSSKNE